MTLPEQDILKLERHQLYPRGDRLRPDFLASGCGEPFIDRSTRIASIGSCFAAHMKKHLIARGFDYVQVSDAPAARPGSAAWGTVFNTSCVAQEFRRADRTFMPRERFWAVGDRLLDPYRKTVEWATEAEAAAEIEEHADGVRRALELADVFIVTAGLTELWHSRADGSVFYQVPPAEVFDGARHAFRRSGVTENVANLCAARAVYRRFNPTGRIVVTVSPVPLRATFSPENVVMANTLSKATLLVAARSFAALHEDVTYFPSYEIVTTAAQDPFMPDNRHVHDALVAKIMRIFEEAFVR